MAQVTIALMPGKAMIPYLVEPGMILLSAVMEMISQMVGTVPIQSSAGLEMILSLVLLEMIRLSVILETIVFLLEMV